MEFSEEVREFLIESNENLGVLDIEVVELEKNPEDEQRIASVFRTIHTIKGTCGFFGFEILGSITHVAENILGQVREKQRPLTPELVSLVLQTVDVVKHVLGNIEESGEEGEDVYQDLRKRLDDAYQFRTGSESALPDSHTELAAESVSLQPGACAESVEAGGATLPDILVESREEEAEFAPTGADVVETAAAMAPPKAEPVAERPKVAAKSEARSADPTSSNSPPPNTAGGSVADSTIRVDVTLLDKLMNLVGELVLARNQILQGTTNQSGASSGAAQRLNLITSELQEGVMRTRMQPIGVVWNKLPRVVRDLASEVGKQIEIQMEGAETELDKTIIEAIKDPLTHIVRNSCDHGIEKPDVRVGKGKKAAGTILLRAYHEGGHVNIEISDDGAGIDPERVKRKAVEKGLIRAEQGAGMSEWEALRLIFLPGFSTAEKITSISGRGVGMDVVKTNIEKIGGAVDLFNRPSIHGAAGGSTVKIKIPLTLAIIPGLIVNLNSSRMAGGVRVKREDRFVIPQANLLELVRLEGAEDRKQIESIQGTEVYRRRGKLLPLTYLSRVLGLSPADADNEVLNIVILQAEDTAFGLVVDGVSDTQEIVVKALGKQLKALSCYVGATIMGDGKIALILDVPGLGRLANILSQSLERGRSESKASEAAKDQRQTLLLFSAGQYPRLVVPLSMVARLEEFASSKVQYAAGLPVLHYRDAILPLVSVGALLGSGNAAMERASLQVIVFSEGNRHVGLVVDEIQDIVEEAVTVKRASSTFGLLGSGVVGGKITDFIDLGALLQASIGNHPDAFSSHAMTSVSLLLVDSSKIARGVLRAWLEMSGHQVFEASTLETALEVLSRNPVGVAITAATLGDSTAGELLDSIRSRDKLAAIPVLAFHDDNGNPQGASPGGEHFDGAVSRDDREGLLRSIESLISESVSAGAASKSKDFALAGSSR